MKFALGIMFHNEAAFLRLHLPVVLQATVFDGVVALDSGSTDDSAAVIRSLCPNVHMIRYDDFGWDFAKQGNALIRAAEEQGHEGMLRLDPDEMMFPEDIDLVPALLTNLDQVGFTRTNFDGDRYHELVGVGHDYQIRGIRLGMGLRYEGRVHEQLRGGMWPALCRKTIYHYEGVRPNTVKRYEKHHNYALLAQGLEPVSLPDDFKVPIGFSTRPSRLFVGNQPLDPDIIGAHAPFGDAQ